MVTKTGVKKLLFYSYLITVHQEIQKKLDSGKHIRDNNKIQLETLCKQIACCVRLINDTDTLICK